MNRLIVNDLIDRIAASSGVDRSVAERFVNAYFAKIADVVSSGRSVEAPGLGVFAVENGEIVFVPDHTLAEAVNAPFSLFEPVELGDEVAETDLEAVEDEPAAAAAEQEQTPAAEPVEAVAEPVAPAATPPPFNPANLSIPVPPVYEPEPHADAPVQPAPQFSEPMQEAEPQIPSEPEYAPEYGAEAEYPAEAEYSYEPPKRRGCFWKALLVILLVAAAYLAGLYTSDIKDFVKRHVSVHVYYSTHNVTADADIADAPAAEAAASDEAVADAASEDILSAEPASEELTVRYDTVRPKYYITHMAKRYYGNDCFWSYIYEENKDMLQHPDFTQPGTVVVIPPAEKYGINAADSASIKASKQLGHEIYKRWQ